MADLTRTHAGLRELALFAGAGGGILGGHILGWRTVCAVERDAYAAQVLAQRQNDRALPAFPIWSDVQSFDGRPWRGRVDVVSGGFPCQDISVAGRGAGIDGERSGMWSHMARVVGEVRPRFVYVENSPAIVHRGLGRVLGDLSALGYDCRWTVVGAADVGANHQRDRFWLLAHANGEQLRVQGLGRHAGQAGACEGEGQERERLRADAGQCREVVGDADSTRLAQRQSERSDHDAQLSAIERADWWLAEPDVDRVVDELAVGMDFAGANEP